MTILPEPKIFYTSVTCATFDKFHVCVNIILTITHPKLGG